MMRRYTTRFPLAALAGVAIALTGCNGDRQATTDGVAIDDGTQQRAPQPEAQPMPQQEPTDLRLEVNVGARELYVYRNEERIATHPVAVGTSEWPTRTGEWTINQVVWNPRWVPPTDESWAEDEEVSEPGDPDNPLGRAQLVYDAPRSIHGTNEPQSLGTAASHGSIRVSNEVAVELARMVMESGGAGRDEGFYQRVRDNRTQREEVAIPNGVPIRVVD
jgi:lipoprotein-anchoring transpeptidase ErfK/SrfK